MLERLVAAVQPTVVPRLLCRPVVLVPVVPRPTLSARRVVPLLEGVRVGGIELERPRGRNPAVDGTGIYPFRVSELGEFLCVGHAHAPLRRSAPPASVNGKSREKYQWGLPQQQQRRHKQQRRQSQAPLNDRERRIVLSAVAGTKKTAKNWSRLDTRTRTRRGDKTTSTRNLSVRKPARPCSTRGPAPVELSSSTPRRTPAPRGSARTCRNRTRNGQPRQRNRRRALSNTERGTIRSAATTRSPGRIAPTDSLCGTPA